MAYDNSYKSGDWWLQCDRCAKKIKASESKHEWTGFIVCPSCFEQRHPQDFLKTKTDKIIVPFSRPRSPDVFVDVTHSIENECNVITTRGMADQGTADCARANISTDLNQPI